MPPPLIQLLRNALFLFSLVFTMSTGAAEAPVRDGLVFWMDAAAQPAARQAASLPAISHLQPVDMLLDSAGGARQAIQVAADRRPVFISDGEAAYIKFDGKDDFLAATGARQLTPAATIFVLAAPKANAGTFSALFSTAEAGKNDYTSGLNLDFGPVQTAELSVLNVESAGTSGFQDLLVPGVLNAAERPFGGFHVFTVRSRIAKAGNELFLDGFKGGDRDRLESMIGLDQMLIGARLYSNDPAQPPNAQGFFEGAIAEVLVYDRALKEEERQRVENALLLKAVKLQALLSGAKGHALEAIKNPPLVQMLVPGFTVHELPLRIGNINNVRYRHDGRVVALGYDGRIHLLSDTDGDGLEDKDELFWDQKTMRGAIGMALTAKGDPRGDGVFVASKGKVSLFVDRNGRAEEEKVVATGWQETFHGVDTLGVALDPKDGSLYFGLGCANFADAYLIDKNTGKSAYDINSLHGTIQHLSADFSTRETICTGVRFTCALAFNRLGDLFATDQEGATWLPNGNPFDELLHIERGKHYGFPPRHPKHLPDVRDEPAVFEYGPQHQSTVGMVFNESVNGGPVFGPPHWTGDAIVCGESRGKIYRTKLFKTPLGYVAQNQLIACLGLLVVDACVTPEGDLLVACHSGPPDWGTGPAGEGRLFKIRYANKDLPQSVIAWAAAPDEFRVAFDRPLQTSDWAEAKEKIRIEAGRFVSAGDRYETVRPGYQAVRDQMATPRRWVDVLGLSLSADLRTLALRVPRQTEPVNYAISLPIPDSWKVSGGLRQQPEIDMQVTLNGISLHDGKIECVLPHPSLAVSAALTAGSAEHEAFLRTAANAAVTLRGLLAPSNPFTPAVQPGAKLDFEPDSFSSALFAVQTDLQAAKDVVLDAAGSGKLKPLSPVTLAGSALLKNGLFLARDDFRRPLSPQRVFVPWAMEKSAEAALAKTRDDVKGNWLHGRRLFFGEAACSACHTLRGEGLSFGPDLSNLIFRDRESVLHDILQPSASINPDHAGSIVKLKNGTSFSGIVHGAASDKTLGLSLPGGAQMELIQDKIAAIEPLKTSLMLEGYGGRLSKEQQEDLLTFLLINPLEAAPILRTEPPAPAPRTRSELAALMLSAPVAGSRVEPLRILLSAGDKDHGINEHDYPLWLERWSKLLALADGVSVKTCMNFPSAEQLAGADVTVFFSPNAGWDLNAAALLDAYQQHGGGLVYIHFALEGGQHTPQLAERAGLAFSASKFRHGKMDLVFTNTAHPITRGFNRLEFLDESYWSMHGDPSRVSVLASSMEENEPRPQLWTMERYKGRLFGCIPGHYTWTFDDPFYRLLVLRGICWAARQSDVERLSELSLVGARFQN